MGLALLPTSYSGSLLYFSLPLKDETFSSSNRQKKSTALNRERHRTGPILCKTAANNWEPLGHLSAQPLTIPQSVLAKQTSLSQRHHLTFFHLYPEARSLPPASQHHQSTVSFQSQQFRSQAQGDPRGHAASTRWACCGCQICPASLADWGHLTGTGSEVLEQVSDMMYL